MWFYCSCVNQSGKHLFRKEQRHKVQTRAQPQSPQQQWFIFLVALLLSCQFQIPSCCVVNKWTQRQCRSQYLSYVILLLWGRKQKADLKNMRKIWGPLNFITSFFDYNSLKHLFSNGVWQLVSPDKHDLNVNKRGHLPKSFTCIEFNVDCNICIWS